MYLCDIGNTHASMNHDGRIWDMPISQFKFFSSKEKIFYINVNNSLDKELAINENFINLEPYFQLDTAYRGLGVDRIAACSSIRDGMIVDAGSAITLDIMSGGIHLGGFILPGLSASLDTFKKISPRLNVNLKSAVELDILPQDTASAISFGIIKPIIMLIEENCKDKKIYFTGGDGAFLSRFFSQSTYSKSLIFNGMKKVIIDNNL